MSLQSYDHLLSFDLPEGFHAIRATDDEGNPLFGIGIGQSTDENGETTYEYRANLMLCKTDEDYAMVEDPSVQHLDGSIQNALRFLRQSQSFLGLEIVFTNALIFLVHPEKTYVLNSVLVGSGERLENWIAFLNDLLACVVLEGQKGDFAPITEGLIDAAVAGDENEAENEADDADAADASEDAAPYPVAMPGADQHSHLDFLSNTQNAFGFLGGMIQMNQSGTEYSFEELDEYFWERYEDADDLISITESVTDFALAETAREMGEIFRVSEDAFDGAEDREQEIEAGLVRRCTMYEAFRSFAWTLAAYCARRGINPDQVTIDDIEDIADFVVEDRGRLNYAPNSYCPTLCSGDDIHNFYIPDAVPAAVRATLAVCITDDPENEDFDAQAHILSLDGLRRDMEYLFPVMQTIYDSLAATRDFDEPLEGTLAEMLYVWCGMTYALRNAVYTEDGPMTCYWDHPGEMPVLKSFGRTITRGEKAVDCGYAFTYNEGITFENEHYTFQFPDGFVVLEGEEDRDFIAYLPNEENPHDYVESPFIIYAGQDVDGSVNAQLSLPLAYHAVLNIFTTQIPDTIPWYYHRYDMPGVIAVSPDNTCLHANAVVPYGETLKMIRFQVDVTGKKQKFACEDLLKSVLDHMVPKHPVTMLDDIDDEKYVEMTLAEDEVAQWTALLNAYVTQVAFARQQHQNQLVRDIQANHPGAAKVKKMVQDMLRRYSEASAEGLKKADAIYQIKRAQYPNHPALAVMKQAMDEAFLDMVVQYVNLDDERVESVDPYMYVYRLHSDAALADAVANVLENGGDALGAAAYQRLQELAAQRG